MPEKPPERKDVPRKREKTAAKSENDEQGTWEQDQRGKSYYYDDSYGYEIYNPDEDDEDDE
jgi:hypothetical protein